MKRIVINKPGSFNRLKIENFEIDQPKDDEVQVRTEFIGVNFADCLVRMGYYSSAKKFVGWPITPGFEFSGIVEKTGISVSKFRPGDRVFGVTLFNAYATNINVPENQIFNIPENLSLVDAGGLPVIYLTAYFALHFTVHIFPESVILVHSAAGGVGSALLQLCKINGWRSIGVVGDISKAEAAEKMGADHVIVKSRENIWEMVERYYPEGVDVILDGNGTSTLKEGLDHLGPTGKMISYGFHSVFSKGGKTNPVKLLYNYLRIPKFNPISPKNLNKSIATFNLSYLFGRNDILQKSMRELLKLIKGNKIMMPNVTVYPFDKVADAHRDLQTGNTIGKLVLHNKIF